MQIERLHWSAMYFGSAAFAGTRHRQLSGSTFAKGASVLASAFQAMPGAQAPRPKCSLCLCCVGYCLSRRHTMLARPSSSNTKVPGSGIVLPLSENAALNVGAGSPPTMSVPTRSQSGARSSFRIHVCRSGLKGVPVAPIGLAADNQRNSPSVLGPAARNSNGLRANRTGS